MSDKILSKDKVDQIIRRISYQILENNMQEDVVFVGVDKGGRQFADLLKKSFKKISQKSADSFTISIDKENPLSGEISMDGSLDKLAGKSVILCDDVLNSGKTLAHTLGKVLSVDVRKVETAVLVLRSHGRFPVHANYKGYELSTTINEHVEVKLDEGVFLT